MACRPLPPAPKFVRRTPTPTYPCGHQHVSAPQRRVPLDHCNCGALGPLDTRRLGQPAVDLDCCALGRGWGWGWGFKE